MTMKLKRGLIVSCQACQGEPLYQYNVMPAMAYAAVCGGAVGIRALCRDIAAIKQTVSVPVIGLYKYKRPESEVYITPTRQEAEALIETGCEVIALDATERPRPNGETLEQLVAYIRKHSNAELMADVATLSQAVHAQELGFDYVSTTLRGYTQDTAQAVLPDIRFMAEVREALSTTKMVAEGGIWEAGQLAEISKLDPYAVVIGTAITRPKLITERFNQVLTLSRETVDV